MSYWGFYSSVSWAYDEFSSKIQGFGRTLMKLPLSAFGRKVTSYILPDQKVVSRPSQPARMGKSLPAKSVVREQLTRPALRRYAVELKTVPWKTNEPSPVRTAPKSQGSVYSGSERPCFPKSERKRKTDLHGKVRENLRKESVLAGRPHSAKDAKTFIEVRRNSKDCSAISKPREESVLSRRVPNHKLTDSVDKESGEHQPEVSLSADSKLLENPNRACFLMRRKEKKGMSLYEKTHNNLKTDLAAGSSQHLSRSVTDIYAERCTRVRSGKYSREGIKPRHGIVVTLPVCTTPAVDEAKNNKTVDCVEPLEIDRREQYIKQRRAKSQSRSGENKQRESKKPFLSCSGSRIQARNVEDIIAERKKEGGLRPALPINSSISAGRVGTIVPEINKAVNHSCVSPPLENCPSNVFTLEKGLARSAIGKVVKHPRHSRGSGKSKGQPYSLSHRPKHCLIKQASDIPEDLVPTSSENEVFPKSVTADKELFFEEKDELGSGVFGAVYKATRSGKNCALKVCISSKGKKVGRTSQRGRQKCLQREADIYTRLKHKSIIACHKVYHDPETKQCDGLLLDLAAGDLQNKLNSPCNVGRKQALKGVLDLLTALSYMHSQGVVHFDLRPDNILSMRNGDLKVSDFGAAQDLPAEKMRPVPNLIGMHKYTAPELKTPKDYALEGKGGVRGYYDNRVDVFSFGMIVKKMAFFFFNLTKEDKELLKKLIQDATENDANKRPYAANLLEQYGPKLRARLRA
ncbi:protein kinase [Parendozoicomonas sp. Alg238-R29]|uniref:protein kinase domain-containing protein n=1 Tax=Parendozoicomonas sp. Alg238-R29 TaxID=2993446 RepID=UPI00248D5935|nr:protein kinase [Parendozoicomonas sp. Alg238-R29]